MVRDIWQVTGDRWQGQVTCDSDWWQWKVNIDWMAKSGSKWWQRKVILIFDDGNDRDDKDDKDDKDDIGYKSIKYYKVLNITKY